MQRGDPLPIDDLGEIGAGRADLQAEPSPVSRPGIRGQKNSHTETSKGERRLLKDDVRCGQPVGILHPREAIEDASVRVHGAPFGRPVEPDV